MESALLKLLVISNALVGVPLWIYARALSNVPASIAAGYLIASAFTIVFIALLSQSRRQQPAAG